MNWVQKLSYVNISINIDDFSSDLHGRLNNIVINSSERHEQTQNFQLNISSLIQNLDILQYPDKQSILDSINNPEWNKLYACYRKFTDWSYKNIKSFDSRQNAVSEISNTLKTMSYKHSGSAYTAEDARSDYSRLVAETQNNMSTIKKHIESALTRIQSWNGSEIIIHAGKVSNNEITSPNYASVFVGQKILGGDCSFTLFQSEDKIEVDDILDAGDDDFFQDSKQEQDYFNLVKELKNPGSTQSNRLLTLYTARPYTDRNYYLSNSNQIPSNIFLASTLNHALALSADLPGGKRDIWRVRIEEKYLLKTLDSKIQEYQVVGDGFVPVKLMELVVPVE